MTLQRVKAMEEEDSLLHDECKLVMMINTGATYLYLVSQTPPADSDFRNGQVFAKEVAFYLGECRKRYRVN